MDMLRELFAAIAAAADWKNLSEIAQAFATAAAVAAAGVWFLRRGMTRPRANVSHQIHQVPLGNGAVLLRVRAEIVNTGEVKLHTPYVRTRVQHLSPLPPQVRALVERFEDPPQNQCEYPWPVIPSPRVREFERRQTQVEPGESEGFDSDFVIPVGVEQVIVYTYIANHTKRRRAFGAWLGTKWKRRLDIGWSNTVVVRLTRRDDQHERTTFRPE